MNEPEVESPKVGSRGPELAVALFLMALAVLVIVDSRRVGTGWGDEGPRSGYFPFYIGLALLVSSGWVALKQLLAWRRDNPVFAHRAQLASVWAVLWPSVIYVAAIDFLGIYVASFILIAYFMFRHGKHAALLTMGVAAGVPLAFFLVFEKWFLVPLPKGPLEALFGL
jgi:putative tricarboxylic transport membrane protein